MYAIGVKDGDCYGVIGEPFFGLDAVYNFIAEHKLDEKFDGVFILRSFLTVTDFVVDEKKLC